MTSPIPAARLLLFDVFGTVVDWRSSIAREVMDVPKARGVKIDAQAFADRWRAGYRPAMDRVRKGELPWTNIDTLHRMVLDAMLPEFGLDGLSEAQRDYFNRAWHRLDPWPDSVAGLTRLKSGFVIATLSNGNVALLTAFVRRPLEHGVRPDYNLPRERSVEYVADDFEDLARQLGV